MLSPFEGPGLEHGMWPLASKRPGTERRVCAPLHTMPPGTGTSATLLYSTSACGSQDEPGVGPPGGGGVERRRWAIPETLPAVLAPRPHCSWTRWGTPSGSPLAPGLPLVAGTTRAIPPLSWAALLPIPSPGQAPGPQRPGLGSCPGL